MPKVIKPRLAHQANSADVLRCPADKAIKEC